MTCRATRSRRKANLCVGLARPAPSKCCPAEDPRSRTLAGLDKPNAGIHEVFDAWCRDAD